MTIIHPLFCLPSCRRKRFLTIAGAANTMSPTAGSVSPPIESESEAETDGCITILFPKHHTSLKCRGSDRLLEFVEREVYLHLR